MDYNQYDDFALTNKSNSGGSGSSKVIRVKSRERTQQNTNQSPDGKYNSKHIRIQQEKQNKSKEKNFGKKDKKSNKKK